MIDRVLLALHSLRSTLAEVDRDGTQHPVDTSDDDLFDSGLYTERHPGCVCTVTEPHNPGECDCPCIACACTCDWRCETEGPYKDDYLACCCDCPHHSKNVGS